LNISTTVAVAQASPLHSQDRLDLEGIVAQVNELMTPSFCLHRDNLLQWPEERWPPDRENQVAAARDIRPDGRAG
jgi:hypothetical protein